MRFGVVLCTAYVLVYGVGHALPRWFPQIGRSAWGPAGPPGAAVPANLADLPVLMVDGHDPNGPVAVILSGNGGWWGVTEGLAKGLAKASVTSVGLNSLAFFIVGHSKAETAATIDRMAAALGPDRPVLLIGYSFGADVVATIYPDLSEATRRRVKVVSLLGLSRVADYAIGFWKLTYPRQDTVPAVALIKGPRVQCVLGREEGERSGCAHLDGRQVDIVTLPGGHHYDGDYTVLAPIILRALTSPPAGAGAASPAATAGTIVATEPAQ